MIGDPERLHCLRELPGRTASSLQDSQLSESAGSVARLCRACTVGISDFPTYGGATISKFARSCEISLVCLPSDMVRDGQCLGSTSLPISGTRTRYRLGLVLSL